MIIAATRCNKVFVLKAEIFCLLALCWHSSTTESQAKERKKRRSLKLQRKCQKADLSKEEEADGQEENRIS